MRKQVIFRQATPTADIRFTHGEGPRASANKVSVYNCGYDVIYKFQKLTGSVALNAKRTLKIKYNQNNMAYLDSSLNFQ